MTNILPIVARRLQNMALAGLLAAAAMLPQTAGAQGKTQLECERELDDAKRAYLEGRLSDIEGKFSPDCRFSSKLSKENKVQAYRLLTETNLFTNRLDVATEYFEELLRYDPLFEVDSTDQVASYDLIYLSRTYRRNPIISWYGSAGGNYSRPEILQIYGASNTTTTPVDVLSNVTLGWNLSTGIEIPVYKTFDFMFEVNFAQRNYYLASLPQVVGSDNNPNGTPFNFAQFQFKEVQTWIDLPVMIRYNYEWKKKILPYAYVGITPNFLLQAKLKGVLRRNELDGRGGGQVLGSDDTEIIITRNIVKDQTTGQEDNYLSTRNTLRAPINVSLVAGVGCKFRLGSNFIFFDIRYNRFLLNAVQIENRYTQKELLYRYGYVDNDFRIDNVSLNLGFMKSFYTPRKKRQYDLRLAEKLYDKKFALGGKKKGDSGEPKTTDEDARRELRDAVNDSKRDKKNYLDAVKAGRATIDDLED